MKKTLSIEIECGEITCASAPGTFCSQLRTSHFGQKWHCAAFGNEEVGPPPNDPMGWLQRLPKCIANSNK